MQVQGTKPLNSHVFDPMSKLMWRESSPDERLCRPRRRRVIGLLAGLPLAAVAGDAFAAGALPIVRWRGSVLGADASLSVASKDRDRAVAAMKEAVGELRRLETVFDLHNNTSPIHQLNKDGRLLAPPAELVTVLHAALRLAKASQGAFDPTVQPLWRAFADQTDIAAARALVDWRQVSVADDEITFQRAGMAVTLNGLANGFLTDRAAAILKKHGFGNILTNVGEFFGAGQPTDRRAWQIGIGDPLIDIAMLQERAIATSEPTALFADAGKRQSHILRPTVPGEPSPWASVSVVAGSALIADGASTAIAAAGKDQAQAILRSVGARRAVLKGTDGEVLRLAG